MDCLLRHSAVPAVDDTVMEAALARMAVGLKSFAELEAATRSGG